MLLPDAVCSMINVVSDTYWYHLLLYSDGKGVVCAYRTEEKICAGIHEGR